MLQEDNGQGYWKGVVRQVLKQLLRRESSFSNIHLFQVEYTSTFDMYSCDIYVYYFTGSCTCFYDLIQQRNMLTLLTTDSSAGWMLKDSVCFYIQ